ncbi:hypothetical protein HU200_066968 [Digitaria exilis]|uniref:Uncharacterized protein n=1 Tax=Digitaria exilis TaxID=1010633 RepID=A0A835DSJ9_9POAL|nr:hypothetical protein HU200_066968 [Digitaria exilis]
MTSRPSDTDLTVALILALVTSGPSSSSSSPTMVHPRRYSILHVILAMFHGAPAIPVLEDGHPAGAEESLWMATRGRVRGVVVGTMDIYLRFCGRIPMLCPDGLFDLNAAMEPPLPVRGDPPVICAYCNCEFCFGVYEVPFAIPPRGLVYPETLANVPPAVTAGVATSAPVRLVCSNRHHFLVGMAMLRQPADAPSLVWRRPSSLGVVPAAVSGSGGAGWPVV